VFIHIHKATGSSAREFFERVYGRESVGWLGRDFERNDLLAGDCEVFNRYKVVGGHFSFDLARRVPGEKVYVSVYRDPVARAISLYRFILRKKIHHLNEALAGMSFSDAVENCPQFRAQINNLQSKYLADIPLANQRKVSCKDVLDNVFSGSFYFSNMENVAQLFDRIKKDFSLPKDIVYGHANKNNTPTEKDSLWEDQEAISKIQKLNAIDSEVVGFFDEHISKNGIIFPENLPEDKENKKERKGVHDMKHILLHIPKTGGTTVHDLLLDKYPQNLVCPERFNSLKNIPIEDLGNYAFFSGHYDWQAVVNLPGLKKIVSLFRNPEKRIVSLYHFWQSHSWHHINKNDLKGVRLAKANSLLDFLNLDGMGIPANIDNAAVRTFLGRMYVGPDREFLFPEDEVVERAAENVFSLSAVGVVEFMRPSVVSIMNAFGHEAPDRIPVARDSSLFHKNSAMERVARPEITVEVKDRLSYLCRYDNELYKRVLDRYYPCLSKSEVVEFEAVNNENLRFIGEGWDYVIGEGCYLRAEKSTFLLRLNPELSKYKLTIEGELINSTDGLVLFFSVGGKLVSEYNFSSLGKKSLSFDIGSALISKFGVAKIDIKIGWPEGAAVSDSDFSFLFRLSSFTSSAI
jgi:hypothetical protein